MRILGIDIGSSAIKAVEIDSAFGRFEIHEYHERPRTEGVSPYEEAAQLIRSLPRPPDRIAASLPTRHVTFRNLTLPTRDKRAIQTTVGFELEDELPFPSEESVNAYTILSQTKTSTQVHVAVTLERYIKEMLDAWSAVGIDPDLLTTQAWAYRNYFNRILPVTPETPQSAPVLLADIGDAATTLYVHWRGVPVLAREIPWGGKDLTLEIHKKYAVPMEQAEQAKLDHGFVIPETQKDRATQEQVQFSDTLLAQIVNLIHEIRQAEFGCKATTRQNFGAIYLSGGTSLLPGLAYMIQEALKIPTRPLQALTPITASGVTYSDRTDATFLLAASLGLCFVGQDRSLNVNFRKGAFAKRGQGRELNYKTLRKPLMAVAAMIVCIFVSLTVQSYVIQSRLKDTDARLEKSIRSFFGQISSSAVRNYMLNTAGLKNSVKKELTKKRELAKLLSPNPHSPLDFLRDLSTSVPKEVFVDMITYQEGASPAASFFAPESGAASLTFMFASPQTADRIASILSGKLSDLKRGGTEEVSRPGGKQWKVTFTGKPQENAYGK